MHAMREPYVIAEPAQLLEVLDRSHSEELLAEPLLLDGLGQVRVQAHAARPRKLRGLAHQLLRDAERRARRQREAHHRAGRGIVPAVDRLRAGSEDRVAVLDDLIWR